MPPPPIGFDVRVRDNDGLACGLGGTQHARTAGGSLFSPDMPILVTPLVCVQGVCYDPLPVSFRRSAAASQWTGKKEKDGPAVPHLLIGATPAALRGSTLIISLSLHLPLSLRFLCWCRYSSASLYSSHTTT